MKNGLSLFIILLLTFHAYCQQNVLEKIKDDKIDWILGIDSLGDDVYMVTGHYPLAGTSGGYRLYYINKDEVELMESRATVNYLNHGRYIKSGDEIYRIRQETKKGQFQLFADKLEGLNFIEPDVPFYVADSFIGNDFFNSNISGNIIASNGRNGYSKTLPTLTALYLDAPTFNSPKYIVNVLDENYRGKNIYGIQHTNESRYTYVNFIKNSESDFTVLLRWIDKNQIESTEYDINFDSAVKHILNAYYTGEQLFIVYIDEKLTIHSSLFMLKNGSYSLVSSSELVYSELTKEFENKDPEVRLTFLVSSTYEVFKYANNNAMYHVLEMNNSWGKMDFFIIKVSEDKIMWIKAIPRGTHLSNGVDLTDKAIDNANFKVEFDNEKMIIVDTELGVHFDKDLNFLKSNVVTGFSRKIYKVKIVIDTETGEFKRKIIEKL